MNNSERADMPLERMRRKLQEQSEYEHHYEQQRAYSHRPEVKEHQRNYRKEYCQRPEVKEHQRNYRKEYYQRPEVKERKKRYNKKYRQNHKAKSMTTTLKSQIIETAKLLATDTLARTYQPSDQPKLQCRYCHRKSKTRLYQNKQWHYYCGRHESVEIVVHMAEIVECSFFVVQVIAMMPPIQRKVSP